MSDERKTRKRLVKLSLVEAEPLQPPLAAGGDGGDGGGGLGDLPGDRPVVQISNGNRHKAIDEAQVHLVKRDLELFQRGGLIVRVEKEKIDIGEGRSALALRIKAVDTQHLRERFTRAIDLRRFDKRADKWLECDCPKDLAEAYLERSGYWLLPELRAVVTAPTLRANGTLIERPGYDRATEIFYDPRGTVFPPVPAAPTRADARDALDRLKGPLTSFDFVDDASRSVALSGILTALVRRTMSAAPLHGFSAPVPGSGKSKLVNIAAILATGHHAAVTALGQREEETEKRLGAALIAGDAVIAIDNAMRPLGGELLCQLLTEPVTNVRVLGKSLNAKVPNVHCVFATGNNLRVIGDMTRRSLIGRIDPHCERPELREFETPDPLLTVLQERPALVIAAMTIFRAFFLAGCPRDEPPLGSFVEWSRWVRDPLIWLGEADPVQTTEHLRQEDPVLSALTAVLHQWQAAIGDAKIVTRELIERAETKSSYGDFLHQDFRDALLAVGGDHGSFSPQRLAKWLSSNKERSVAGLALYSTKLDGLMRWQVRAVTTP